MKKQLSNYSCGKWYVNRYYSSSKYTGQKEIFEEVQERVIGKLYVDFNEKTALDKKKEEFVVAKEILS